jgi:hypothetical protein
MNINCTSKRVDYDTDGTGYHFGAHFNSNAQVLSFNIDIGDMSKIDEIIELFKEEFKPEIIEYIEEDIVIPEIPEEEPTEEEPEEEIPDEESPEEGENE